jgi:hypothetical protein
MSMPRVIERWEADGIKEPVNVVLTDGTHTTPVCSQPISTAKDDKFTTHPTLDTATLKR